MSGKSGSSETGKSTGKILMETQKNDNELRSLIERAIREEITISVSLKTKHRSSFYYSKFLNVDCEQIILEVPSPKVVSPRDPVTEVFITFCNAQYIYSFTAALIGKQKFHRNDCEIVSGLAISLPTHIRESDRRNYERIYVEEDINIHVSFWFEGESQNKYFGLLHNISLEGIGILFKTSNKSIVFQNNIRCDIAIHSSTEDDLLILPARYRFREKIKDENSALLGFQFDLANHTTENLIKLGAIDQLINHLQSSCNLNLIC